MLSTFFVIIVWLVVATVLCCVYSRRLQTYLAPKDKFLAACWKANFESSVLIALHRWCIQSRIHIYSTHTYKLRRLLKMNTLFLALLQTAPQPTRTRIHLPSGETENVIRGRSCLKYIIAYCKSHRSGIEFYFWKAKGSLLLLLLLLPMAPHHALHHR